ncbi:NUDIX domain-containing protein [Maricaulis sp. CAU 1757]
MSWKARIEPVWRPVIQTWWRLSRGMTLGVRGIVTNPDGQVVLVRHTYVTGWHLPGGGVERGESALEALHKELQEEAGVRPTGPVQAVGLFANRTRFRGDHVMVYRVSQWQACQPDCDGEIAEIGWFDPQQPPEGATEATRLRLAECFSDECVSPWWS